MAILVIAEHEQGALKIGTRQAVTAAQQLGGDIHLLLAGNALEAALTEARPAPCPRLPTAGLP